MNFLILYLTLGLIVIPTLCYYIYGLIGLMYMTFKFLKALKSNNLVDKHFYK